MTENKKPSEQIEEMARVARGSSAKQGTMCCSHLSCSCSRAD